MMARVFSHPEWLPAVCGVVVAGSAVAIAGGLRARARLRRLLGDGRPVLFGGDLRLVAALLATGLALLGPLAGHRTERATVSGVDLVVLFDVSRSMDARDTPPSRLERAVQVAADVLEGLGPGDRAALAAFAGRGVLLTPLTPDASALREMLSGIDIDLMQSRGSELGAGVREALTAFQDESPRPRVLLLLSDGEAPLGRDAGDLGTAEAVRAGVRIVAVGLGTEVGATIPDHGVPLLDASGRVVVSRRDAGRLAALARATGGAVEGTDGFGAVDRAHLLNTLRRDASAAPGVAVERRLPRSWVWPIALLAFALLLPWEAGLAFRLHGVRRASARFGLAALMALAALGLAPAARTTEPAPPDGAGPPDVLAELPKERLSLDELESLARARPSDPLALLRLGLARSRAGLEPDAARAYLAAGLRAHDPATAALAFYDFGVAELAQGDLAAARDAFFDALALQPQDPHAQFNLEWTLRALAAHLPPPPETRAPAPRPGGPGNPNEKDKQGAQGRGREAQAPRTGTLPKRPAPSAGEARRPAPEPGSAAASQSAPQGEPGASESARIARHAPVLSAEEARLWLAHVTEEPGHALRQAARRTPRGEGAAPGPPANAPAW
jgi:Ca-activated chloride channel family protein